MSELVHLPLQSSQQPGLIRVKVYGDKVNIVDELEEDFHAHAIEAVNEATALVLGVIRQKLSARKGTRQTAAPAGESPEEDTGKLIRSFRQGRAKVKGRSVIGTITSNDPGVNRLEYGFVDSRGIRTLPHPTVRPAFKETEAAVVELLRERLT